MSVIERLRDRCLEVIQDALGIRLPQKWGSPEVVWTRFSRVHATYETDGPIRLSVELQDKVENSVGVLAMVHELGHWIDHRSDRLRYYTSSSKEKEFVAVQIEALVAMRLKLPLAYLNYGPEMANYYTSAKLAYQVGFEKTRVFLVNYFNLKLSA